MATNRWMETHMTWDVTQPWKRHSCWYLQQHRHWGHCAKWNKPDRERQITVWYHLYVKSKMSDSWKQQKNGCQRSQLKREREKDARAKCQPKAMCEPCLDSDLNKPTAIGFFCFCNNWGKWNMNWVLDKIKELLYNTIGNIYPLNIYLLDILWNIYG